MSQLPSLLTESIDRARKGAGEIGHRAPDLLGDGYDRVRKGVDKASARAPDLLADGFERVRKGVDRASAKAPAMVSGGLDRAKRSLDDYGPRVVDVLGERRTWAVAGAAVAGFVAGVALLSGRKLAMQATTAVAGDWFAQLKAEHRQVEALFKAVHLTKDKDVAKRTALLAHIAYALLKHGVQEETVIYPAMRGAQDEAPAKQLAAEHFDIKTYLHELSEMDKDSPKWMKKLKVLEDLVAEHVREEEDELFPALRARLSAEENAHLTKAMNREGIKLA